MELPSALTVPLILTRILITLNSSGNFFRFFKVIENNKTFLQQSTNARSDDTSWTTFIRFRPDLCRFKSEQIKFGVSNRNTRHSSRLSKTKFWRKFAIFFGVHVNSYGSYRILKQQRKFSCFLTNISNQDFLQKNQYSAICKNKIFSKMYPTTHSIPFLLTRSSNLPFEILTYHLLRNRR